MRNFLSTAVCVVLAVLCAVSCSQDAELAGMRPLSNNLGVITYVGVDSYFEITDDKDNVYIVTDTPPWEYAVEEGKRLYFSYHYYIDVTNTPDLRPELQGKETVLNIEPERLEYVLSKPVIRESFIIADEIKRRDSIGFDGIRPYGAQTAWLGGDYLNVNFEYLRYKDSRVRHMVNLVWDDRRQPEDVGGDGCVHLYLRHNAYWEIPISHVTPESDTGMCSFDISEIVPEGSESVRIKLFWTWYRMPGNEIVEYSEEIGEFFPSGVGRDDIITDPGDQLYYVSPPANPTAFVM